MTLTIELTPTLEAKLRARAAQEGRDEAEIAHQAVEQYLQAGEAQPTAPTIGAQILAEWEEEGVLGLWQDRPEDSIELAREFRRQAEARGSGA
jgi:predicted transcriptional regulator